ncbi:MAG: flagellar filament capping protein FliD [Vicinamibacteraceae bacterium]
MSSPITLSGFNNIDFSSVLNALMAQERIPVTQLETQQTALTRQKTFFSQFASKLASLESSVASLTSANAFEGRSATVSDPTAATVQVGGTTPRGSYSIAVTSLAKAQVTGTASVHTDHDSTIVAGAGTLTIGGVAVTLTGGVTLDGLADAINSTPNVGVSASVVQNGANFQLVVTGQATGAANTFAITNGLSGGSGVGFAATNAQDASNAEGTVNGIAFSTPTNTVQGVVPQSTLELVKTAAPTNPIVVTITGDRTSVKELVRKMTAAYNDVVAFIDDQQLAAKEKNPASIGRDPLVRDLRSQLARVLNTERTVPGGLFTAVSQVGLGFSRTGQLEFNEAEFDSALDRDTAGVQNLFRGSGGVTGAFSDLTATIATYTSAGGLLPTAQTRLSDQVLKIGQRISDYELRLARRREALQKEFTAADLAIKQLNNSLGQLSSLGASQ